MANPPLRVRLPPTPLFFPSKNGGSIIVELPFFVDSFKKDASRLAISRLFA
jgi:hypothetical protein